MERLDAFFGNGKPATASELKTDGRASVNYAWQRKQRLATKIAISFSGRRLRLAKPHGTLDAAAKLALREPQLSQAPAAPTPRRKSGPSSSIMIGYARCARHRDRVANFLLNNHVKPIAHIPTKPPCDLSRSSAPPSAGHDLLVRVNAIGQPRWTQKSAAAWEALFDRLGIDRNGGNRDQLLIVRGAGGVGRSPSNSPSLPD